MKKIIAYLGIGTVAILCTIYISARYKNYTPGLTVPTVKLATQADRVPVNIILNTIPKSASVYITKVMERSLGSEILKISPGYFPHDNLLYKELAEFSAHKNAVAKSHLDASIFNQQMLKKYTDRIVLQFRDPREVMLSWIHYIQRIHAEGKTEYLYHFAPTPPEEYFNWNLDKQIDWNIVNFLPHVIRWMDEWLKFKEQEDSAPNGYKILITTYDEFKQNELGFYEKILNFYNIPRAQFKFIHPKLDMQVHFRRGDQNEWRHVYNEQQIQQINLSTSHLLRSFNWPLN